MALHEEVDVVVIGSGAGGSPVALTLAEAGARVVVLEKGPYYTIRDFTHDEVAICLRDFWAPFPTEDPHTFVYGNSGRSIRSNEGWTGVCVGGGTVHMSGYFYRFRQYDLQLATYTGGITGADIVDWPITLDELNPFYELVETRLGISGEVGSNPFDPPRKPYPLPPIPAHPLSRLVDESSKQLGFHSFSTPRAVLSRPYGGRPPCNQCGMCGDYGCETGAKSSMLATLIPLAEATGNCEIRPRCTAQRILLDRRGRASKVEYVDYQGYRHSIKTRLVVLAATAIESARLLLLSSESRFPHGLANGSGLVGRNLTFSTAAKGTAVFDRQELVARLGREGMDLPFLQRSIENDYWNERAGFVHPKGGLYNFIMLHKNIIFAAQRLFKDSNMTLWGAELKNKVRALFHEEVWAEFEAFSEFLPWKDCWVELDDLEKDKWGIPVARIRLKHHPDDIQISRRMVERGNEILAAIKPSAKTVSTWTWGVTTPHLQHGTCRFGSDSTRSVLNRDCQAHEITNLYVTDGSFLPNSGGVPATLTILANSFRVAHLLRKKFLAREFG